MEHSLRSQSRSYGNDFDIYNEDEYYDTLDNGLSADYDPSRPLEPLVSLHKSSVSMSSDGSWLMYDAKRENQDHDESKHDAFELFFNTFFDEELDGEITICQFVAALNELFIDITDKEIYAMFNYIDHDETGFIDAVDFAAFCTTNSFEMHNGEQCHEDIKRLQHALNSVIESHPFMMTTLDTAHFTTSNV
eukprot:120595_1